jgi:hypothetical protein
MATVGCGISERIQNIQINAATTEHKQHRNKVMKPQRNTFSKYCKDNKKQSLT